jgi:hypothetical protein
MYRRGGAACRQSNFDGWRFGAARRQEVQREKCGKRASGSTFRKNLNAKFCSRS